MIVLDANVISVLMAGDVDVGVKDWVDQHPVDDVFLTAITSAEVLFGIARLPEGKRKRELGDRAQEVIDQDFTDRILPFDHEAAIHFAPIVAGRERKGLPISTSDAQIAAICRSVGAGLATRNVKDFTHTGIRIVNPWTRPDRPDGSPRPRGS